MRLIDADVLKEAFEEDGHLTGYIEEFIDDTPTIEVEPKHAYWQMIGIHLLVDQYQCLNCDELFYLKDITPATGNYKYCPNCAAKIDGVLPAKYGGFITLDDPSKIKGVE